MSTKKEVYNYKVIGGWRPFFLTPEQGKKWTEFNIRLRMSRPEAPDPDYNDYMTFLSTLKK